jgi:hypothetical protein
MEFAMPKTLGGLVTKYHAFFAPLGELTIAFSLMEQKLDDAIRVLEELPYPEAVKVVASVDITTKIGRLHSAATQSATTSSLRDERPSLICDLHAARDRRYKAQHGPWLSPDEAGTAAKIGQRDDHFEWHDHTPASLQDDATFCFNVMLRVTTWTARFVTEGLVPRNNSRTARQ